MDQGPKFNINTSNQILAQCQYIFRAHHNPRCRTISHHAARECENPQPFAFILLKQAGCATESLGMILFGINFWRPSIQCQSFGTTPNGLIVSVQL